MDVVKSIFVSKKDATNRPLPEIPQANNTKKESASDSSVLIPRISPKTERGSTSLNDNQQRLTKPFLPNRTDKKSSTLPHNIGPSSQGNINDSSAGKIAIECPCGANYKSSPATNDENNFSIECACGRVFKCNFQPSSQQKYAVTCDKNNFLGSKPSKLLNENKGEKSPGVRLPIPPKISELKLPTKNSSNQHFEDKNKFVDSHLKNSDNKKVKGPPPETPCKPITSPLPKFNNINQKKDGNFKLTKTSETGSYLVAKSVETSSANFPPLLENGLTLTKCAEQGSYALSYNLPIEKQSAGLNLEVTKEKKTGYYHVKTAFSQDQKESQHPKKSPPPQPPVKFPEMW